MKSARKLALERRMERLRQREAGNTAYLGARGAKEPLHVRLHKRLRRRSTLLEVLARNKPTSLEQILKLLPEELYISPTVLAKELARMGVVRLPKIDGGFYFKPGHTASAPGERALRDSAEQGAIEDLVRDMLRRYCLGIMVPAEETPIVVLNTGPHFGVSLGAAVQSLDWPEIVSVMKDDATVWILTRDMSDAWKAKRLLVMLAGETKEERFAWETRLSSG